METIIEQKFDPPDECLFVMNQLVTVSSIRLAARSAVGSKQILAFIMGNGDLSLHFIKNENVEKPIMRHIPWFCDTNRHPSALCFDPSGNWLLLTGHDSSIFIIPALALVDGTEVQDHRWSTTDITVFPPPSPSSSGQRTASMPRPTAVVWWQSIMGCHHTAIVGHEGGMVTFISLATGVQVGCTYVKESISSLHICQDNSLDIVFLLVTCSSKAQWKLVLEQRTTGYTWPVDSAVSVSKVTNSGHLLEPDGTNRSMPRSRLQGLKQLSVEKLASIRHKLAETRSRGVSVVQTRRESSSSSSDEAAASLNRKSSSASSTATESNSAYTTTGPLPEALGVQVGDTFLWPQYARGRYLLSGYYSPSSILTIHGMDLNVVPLFVHKLPPDCGDILVTDRFLYVTDSKGEQLFVGSTQLSECRLDGDSDYNPDSIMNTFTFGEDERILYLFKRSVKSSQSKDHTAKHHHRSSDYERSESRKYAHKKQEMCEEERQASEFKLPQSVSDLKIDVPQIDTVIVVTNRGIYEVNLKCSATEIFMELVLKMQEVERAEKIALIFGLNLQQLLEMAGDLKLAEKDFPQAIALYKLSRCRHLKSVLKFAVAGHSVELLGYVNLLLETSGLDLTTPERIHLANIAVMAHSEQVLRATVGKTGLLKKYLKFLQDNKYYDEVLAVNVAGQTGLWDVLQFLSQQRGLQPEVIDVLVKMFRPQNTASLHQSQKLGMWMCVSDPSLLQALICRPLLASQHIKFVSSHLPELEMSILERLANLYDPSSPVLRPAIVQMFTARKRSQSCSSTASSQETIELSEVNDEITIPLEKMIHLFLLILLYMEKQRYDEYTYNMELMEKVDLKSNSLQKNKPCVQLQLNHLSAGFAHVALVRNANVYSWGNAVNGCLGLGPTMSRYGTPQLLPLFPTLKLHVFAVACGRNHTLALTNNGVYSWGSSQYGQLGLGPGRTGQTPVPCLVMGLAGEQIVAISAGQYHSLSLTEDGRVFSWGWGVHGQLGLKLIENAHSPEPMKLLSHKIVTHIHGGYGHSLMLTSDGEVYTCGSSVFGQLGNGTNIKSSVPIMVSAIPEPCTLISTAYFHNLALGKSQKLYIWGSSPQVLRIQAQAQKKARLMQQQSPPTEKPGLGLQTDIGSSGLVVSPSMEFKGLASIGSDVNTSQNNPQVSSPHHTLHHDVGEDKEGQHHLLPQVVDTSLVNGSIMQLSCGCHHSALLTSDGNLYLWGRNLDGQLGSGSRKEVLIPTPMIPAKKSPTQSAVGGIPEQCHLQQISCGCEFTAALEADRGRLWTWGNNSFGQLGKAPTEEGKALEGRLVMLKTSKRVIKLPHGAHNASDLPQEVLGIPSNIITFQSQPLAALKSPPCPILKEAESPPYGAHTLHFALQHFHGCYESNSLLSKCLELENFQAAAKISILDRQYHLALCYQLKAFALASNKIMEKNKLLHNKATELQSKNYNNKNGLSTSDNTIVHKSLTENSQCNADQLNKTNDEISEKNEFITTRENNVGCEDKFEAINRNLQSTIPNIKDPEITSPNTSSTTEEKPEQKYLLNGHEISVHKADSSTEKSKNSLKSLPTMPANSPDQSNFCETPDETQNDITDEKRSFSVSSTPESLTSSEIHAFAIQGGTEEMSEENRYMTSPESPQLSIVGLQTPDLTSSLKKEEGPFVHPDVVGTTSNIDKAMMNRSHLTYSLTPELLQVQKQKVVESFESNEKHIKEVNNHSNDGKNILLNEISSQHVQYDLLNSTNTKETKESADSVHEDFLISKAAAIVEYHVSVMEEDSHTMMSRLLQQGIDFWMTHSLPVESLECLLLKHMTKLFYPLGFQLFCKENSSEVLNHLSPQFCLQLCSSLLTSLEQKKAPNDFIELLVQSLTSLNSSNGQFLGSEASQNSLDAFVTELLSGGLSSLSVHTSQSDEVLDSRNIFAFSCGHHYSKTSVDIPQWPVTANLLRGLYNTEHSRILPLACPRCVLGHIENQQSTKA